MGMEIIFWVVLLFAVVWLFSTYNGFVKLIEAAKNSNKEIDIQLDARGKKFDSLVNAVKKYMSHEMEVFTKISELRTQGAKGGAEGKKAEEDLSKIVNSGELKSSINIAVESYPDLKSNENMLQLQEEIVAVENKLTFAKKAYNNAVENYSIKKASMPDLFIPKIFSSLDQEFEYWSLSEEAIQEEEARRVSF